MPEQPSSAPGGAPTPWQKVLVGAALLAVYLIWGSTYFAMRVALEVLPSFLMSGSRFLVAGTLLLVVLRIRGAALPTARQWRSAALIGVLLLFFGNGFVALAQRTVDSGVAATVVAAMPLWTAAIGSVWGDRPTIRELIGLLVGFAGVVVLHRGGNLSFLALDSILLLLAPIAWAFGSLLSRRLSLPAGAMGTAAQMLVGGAVMLAFGLLRGETLRGPPTPRTAVALLYLIVFGSLVAFSAYGFLLRTTRPSTATSYAYVNPVVALAIGWAFGGEGFGLTKIVACALTIGGVLVVSAPRPKPQVLTS